ncbi:DoxX family protein [Sinobaca sp. H24]|uniref:DoxX family protein n=1 Tax=Sinobaca sp. H24 TaxID=2923376 RepID=UPI0020799861|nr:DoxX family protein [Sinobaca sp. H24]
MNKQTEWALVVGRMILGAIMLTHGVSKFIGLDGLLAQFDVLGFPAALAYVTVFVEAGAGATLLLGIFVRISAALLGFTMAGAIILVDFQYGLIQGYELPLVLLGLSAVLTLVKTRKGALYPAFHRPVSTEKHNFPSGEKRRSTQTNETKRSIS